MDAREQLEQDFRDWCIDIKRLLDVVAALQRQLEAAQRQLNATKERIAELEENLGGPATAKVTEPFSLRAEENRQEKRRKKKRKLSK